MDVKIRVPLFGYPTYLVPYYIKDPKRDPNFDKHPYVEGVCIRKPPKANVQNQLRVSGFQTLNPKPLNLKTLRT